MSKANIVITSLFLSIFILLLSNNIYATEKKSTNGQTSFLNYTYVGPMVGVGLYHAQYKNWNSSSNLYETTPLFGLNAYAGVDFTILTKHIIAKFNLLYLYSRHLDSNEIDIHNLYYTISGKYNWQIVPAFSINTGLGVYFESPPSNQTFKGCAGGMFLFGITVKTTFETLLVIDAEVRYGFFGMGEESTKLSYGLNIGFLFKIGRL